jgi:hypothetical protein
MQFQNFLLTLVLHPPPIWLLLLLLCLPSLQTDNRAGRQGRPVLVQSGMTTVFYCFLKECK